MENITYEKAKIEQCLELSKVKRQIWFTTYRGIYSDQDLNYYSVHHNKNKFEESIANPNVSLYVAAQNDRIVGFMRCGQPQRPFQDYKQDIGQLYVLNEYQKKGIGKGLFLIGKNIVADNGFSEFFVSVNKYNKNALDFYIAMGGKIVHIDKDHEDKRNVQIKLRYTV